MTVPQSIRKNVIINKITHIYYNEKKCNLDGSLADGFYVDDGADR